MSSVEKLLHMNFSIHFMTIQRTLNTHEIYLTINVYDDFFKNMKRDSYK